MPTSKPPHPQLHTLKSALHKTLTTLQTHLTTTRNTHTQNIEALATTHENLLSQALAVKAYAYGQNQLLLRPAAASSSASSLAERILSGPVRKIASLIRNEVYASSRREEDTLAVVQALEWEVEALVGQEEEEEEEEYEHGYGYGYEEEGHAHFHQDIQFSEDVTYIWDGEGYRAWYNFGPVEEEGEKGKGE